jgi:hypothetical protein
MLRSLAQSVMPPPIGTRPQPICCKALRHRLRLWLRRVRMHRLVTWTSPDRGLWIWARRPLSCPVLNPHGFHRHPGVPQGVQFPHWIFRDCRLARVPRRPTTHRSKGRCREPICLRRVRPLRRTVGTTPRCWNARGLPRIRSRPVQCLLLLVETHPRHGLQPVQAVRAAQVWLDISFLKILGSDTFLKMGETHAKRTSSSSTASKGRTSSRGHGEAGGRGRAFRCGGWGGSNRSCPGARTHGPVSPLQRSSGETENAPAHAHGVGVFQFEGSQRSGQVIGQRRQPGAFSHLDPGRRDQRRLWRWPLAPITPRLSANSTAWARAPWRP